MCLLYYKESGLPLLPSVGDHGVCRFPLRSSWYQIRFILLCKKSITEFLTKRVDLVGLLL